MQKLESDWVSPTVRLCHGDCLDIMPTLPDHSFDAIIADLPYGTTACKWDSVIPFEPLWAQYKRLIKEHGAIVLFGSQPFTSALVMSNVEWFRYCLVWEKSCPTGFLDANRKPLKAHEDISVFYAGLPTYNPQMTAAKRKVTKRSGNAEHYGAHKRINTDNNGLAYPRSVLYYARANDPQHPTQKPVALLEYLIRTYTNVGDTILDNTMGSGTTMVACVHTGRDGTGIEMLPVEPDDPDYFGRAQRRIEHAQNEIVQLELIGT